MTSITLVVNGADIRCEVRGVLTSGMVGIPVTIRYDRAWQNLTKNLVCRSGLRYGPANGTTRIIANVETAATVAHEVMEADKYLYLGIEGYSPDGNLVIPTKWVECGKIYPGANAEGDPAADPTLPVWAQLEADMAELEQSCPTEEQIEAVVKDYLDENPTGAPDPYVLPVAAADTLGGVMPVAKTDAMTQEVGADENGRLYTAPGESGGTDDYAVLTNKPSINGVTLEGDKTAEDLGLGVTGEQVSEAVGAWLEAHPESTATVADGGITAEKLADGAVTAGKINGLALRHQPIDPNNFAYELGAISDSGAVDNSAWNGAKYFRVSPFLQASPDQLYTINFNTRYANVACYDGAQNFIEKVTVSSNQFTTAAETEYIRFDYDYASLGDAVLQAAMICEGNSLYDFYHVGNDPAWDGLLRDNSADGVKLKDGTVDGSKLKDESVSGKKIMPGTISAEVLSGGRILKQLFDQEEYLAFNAAGGYLLSGTSGTAVGGSNATYRASDFVAAKPNQVYTCNWMPHVSDKGEYGSVCCYDSDKTFLAKADLNENLRFTTPDGTAYIRFGDYDQTTDEKSAGYMICEGETLFSGYVPGGEKVVLDGLLLDKSTPVNSVDGAVLEKASIPRDRLAPPDGLKICCYGDSLTQNMYPSKVAALLSAEVVDAGVGGNTVSAICNRVGNYGTDFNVVTLMCGTNDNGGVTSCPLGTVDDAAATDDNATSADTSYASRLKRLIDKIKATHPGAAYIIMPPFVHAWGDMEAVADLMEQIAALYSIPFLDICHLCGWRGTDETDKATFMSDDTHENDVGAQRIAELLAGCIRQLKGF